MSLKEYEVEILKAMYNAEVIGMKYRPIETLRSKCNWIYLTQRFKIRKSFPSVMKGLEGKGYISSHGKSGAVYSLSELGVFYVKGLFTK